MADRALSENMIHSTTDRILKNKDKIMEHVKSTVPMMWTIRLKKGGKVMEKVGKLLSMHVKGQHQHQV